MAGVQKYIISLYHIRGSKHFSESAYHKHSTCTYLVEILPLVLAAEFCASLTDTVIAVSLSLGPSVAIKIFHWCLVRSWLFADAGRYLTGLFTFLSSRLVQTDRGSRKELVQNYHCGKKTVVVSSTIDILHTESTLCHYEVLVGWLFAFGLII